MIFCTLAFIYFSIFQFNEEFLIAYFFDFAIIIEGILASLMINCILLKFHRYFVIANFLFKIIMVWVDLFSALILSWIFSWEIEILTFIILQILFILFDAIPVFTIFLLFLNDINENLTVSQHLMAEMVIFFVFFK